jgi:hypothetical protein
MPTGFGWLAIVSGFALAPTFFLWRNRYRAEKWSARLFFGLLALFLFTIIQWASWYK